MSETIKFVPYAIEPDITQKDRVAYKIRYKSLIINSNWIRIVANNSWDLSGWDFGGFDFGPEPLPTQALTSSDREALEKLELF